MQDRVILVAALMAGIVVLVGLSAVLLIQEARRRDLEARIVATVWGSSVAKPTFSGIIGCLHRLGEWARRSGRLYSPQDLEKLEGMVSAAGFNPRHVLPLLLGGKIIMTLALPVLAVVVGSFAVESLPARVGLVAAALIVGMLGPDWLLRALRRSYDAALERGTPDALDLLVVCSEAGMGLESALERVSQEMYHSNRPVAAALSGLLDDLRVLPDRREAFQKFARRSGAEGLQRLATMLAQALQFGTPLGQALRAVASELRRDRANKLEEKAVKLPAKLIFPLILFILPCLSIILIGTSFLRLYDSLASVAASAPAAHRVQPPTHR
jgi:tight adherence protein C